MTERLADIVAQIQNVRQLEAVVTAMRGIAASRAQKARSLLAGIRAYTEVVSRAIGQALSFLPSDGPVLAAAARSRRGFILFCAEQGFAGAFSERVLDTAAARLAGATRLVIGTRGATAASERGIKADWWTPMVTNVEAIPTLANRIADVLYGYANTGVIAAVDMVFSRSMIGTGIRVEHRSLLPIDFERFPRLLETQPPMTNLAPEILLERLAAEYVYAQLCEAATEAFSAENEARMVAMTAARTNIETKLTALSQRERELRQQEITMEAIELSAGTDMARRPR